MGFFPPQGCEGVLAAAVRWGVRLDGCKRRRRAYGHPPRGHPQSLRTARRSARTSYQDFLIFTEFGSKGSKAAFFSNFGGSGRHGAGISVI